MVGLTHSEHDQHDQHAHQPTTRAGANPHPHPGPGPHDTDPHTSNPNPRNPHMIRAHRLAVSRPMYAFDPTTWRASGSHGFEVDAVWFKRKNGILAATQGVYHPMVLRRDAQPADDTYATWIAAADDNRYGGKWIAQWDGTGLRVYATPVSPETADGYIRFLSSVLEGHPAPPAGYDGWYEIPPTP